MRWYLHTAIVSLAYFTSLTSSQGILSTIPQCYRDCIQSAGDFTCNGLDIPCLCRLSNGNFITRLLTCIRADCDNNLNVTELVGPVAQVCAARGVPIAPSIISSAENIGSSLAATAKSTLSGATTVTSSYASAGTRYVVVVPLSASRGQSGSVRTITGTIKTILAASITGSGLGATESDGSSSSASSTSTVTAVNTATITKVTSSASSSASSTSTTTAVNTVTSTAIAQASSSSSSSGSGGGAPAANSNSGDGSGDGTDEGKPRQGGDGTPFTSEGFLIRHDHHGWLGIGFCFVVVLFAAL
ncbi:MAG: hypothetical protein M1816_005056 [Peltula sp. TS41687]|nr:MAG: hypothetical protein M1816_005056 [Peltula sp. TS41687]